MRKDVDRTVKGAVAYTRKERYGAEAAIVRAGRGLLLERAIP